MPTFSFVDPRPTLDQDAGEDLYAQDRLIRSFLRSVVRFQPGSSIAIHGAPGSGKNFFMLRAAWLLERDREGIGFDEDATASANWCWYNPWLYQKHGHIVSGLVATMALQGHEPQLSDRARDIVGHTNRMAFDAGVLETAGSAITRNDANPVSRIRASFVGLVELLKVQSPGRVLVFIEDLDLLHPRQRLVMLEGLRLLVSPEADVTFILGMGREAALDAVRFREGRELPEVMAAQALSELIDNAITVPPLDLRRVGQLLRYHLEPAAHVVEEAFGPDAMELLIAAAADRPLSSPRVIERLAGRVIFLAEYLLEMRAKRELSETQWAWVVVAERWPEFRRFMMRGGRERWGHLRAVMAGDAQATADPAARELVEWLRKDLLLAEFLRAYAAEFERESDAVYWLETYLLAGGQ